MGGNLIDNYTQQDEILREIRDKLNEPGTVPANYGTVLNSILSELKIWNSGDGTLPQPGDPRLFAYPADGTRVALTTVGTYIVDFYQGTVMDPNGAVTAMDKSLQSAHLEFLKAALISVDVKVIARFDSNDRIPVASYYSSNEQPFKRVEITISEPTNLLIVASSSPTIISLLDGSSGGGLAATPKKYYASAKPTASCAPGTAIEFDITGFADDATLKMVNITQLTADPTGTYKYTLEIWEKDSAGYTPGTATDMHLLVYSREFNTQHMVENIDGGLLCRDQDATKELHCRIVNDAASTASAFDLVVTAEA